MRRLLSGRIQRQILRSLKYDTTKADLSFRHGLPVITVTLPSRKGSRQKCNFHKKSIFQNFHKIFRILNFHDVTLEKNQSVLHVVQ